MTTWVVRCPLPSWVVFGVHGAPRHNRSAGLHAVAGRRSSLLKTDYVLQLSACVVPTLASFTWKRIQRESPRGRPHTSAIIRWDHPHTHTHTRIRTYETRNRQTEIAVKRLLSRWICRPSIHLSVETQTDCFMICTSTVVLEYWMSAARNRRHVDHAEPSHSQGSSFLDSAKFVQIPILKSVHLLVHLVSCCVMPAEVFDN